jgi:hypothetical protein
MYLTGSRALLFWQGFDCSAGDSDWDIIANEEELNLLGLSFGCRDSIRVGDVEFINEDSLNNKEVCSGVISSSYHNGDLYFNFNICDLNSLYIQKRSHVWRPIKFARHIMQLQNIISLLEEELPLSERNQYLLKKRIKLTKEKYGDRVPSLNKSNKDFFDDTVKKYYVHDEVHEVMAHYDRPLYESLKYDDKMDSAFCSKDLWEKLSYEDKVKCVQEECYVIAVERFVIPRFLKGEKYPPENITFMRALEKVCTTLCSGYFRDFAIDNWSECRKFTPGFYNKLFTAIDKGVLEYAN